MRRVSIRRVSMRRESMRCVSPRRVSVRRHAGFPMGALMPPTFVETAVAGTGVEALKLKMALCGRDAHMALTHWPISVERVDRRQCVGWGQSRRHNDRSTRRQRQFEIATGPLLL